jgi:hypothetical protein
MPHFQDEDPEDVFLDAPLPDEPMRIRPQFTDLVENSTCDGSIKPLQLTRG